MKKKSLVFLFVIFAISAFAENGTTPEEIIQQKHAVLMAKINSIDAATLKSWIDNKKEFILLDVRELEEINAVRIIANNKIEIPRGIVEIFPRRVPNKEATVVVYCSHGRRSAAVTDLISEFGYKNVYNLENGIFAWIKSGYQVANYYGTYEMKNFKPRF